MDSFAFKRFALIFLLFSFFIISVSAVNVGIGDSETGQITTPAADSIADINNVPLVDSTENTNSNSDDSQSIAFTTGGGVLDGIKSSLSAGLSGVKSFFVGTNQNQNVAVVDTDSLNKESVQSAFDAYKPEWDSALYYFPKDINTNSKDLDKKLSDFVESNQGAFTKDQLLSFGQYSFFSWRAVTHPNHASGSEIYSIIKSNLAKAPEKQGVFGGFFGSTSATKFSLLSPSTWGRQKSIFEKAGSFINILIYGFFFILILEAILNVCVWVFQMTKLRKNPLFKPIWKIQKIFGLMILVDLIWLAFVYISFFQIIALCLLAFGIVLVFRKKPNAAYYILPATFFIPLFVLKTFDGSIFVAVVHAVVVAFLEFVLSFFISSQEKNVDKAKEKGGDLAENIEVTDELTRRIAAVVKEDAAKK